jgi:decaprenyl-phosphate phosphoribosyltransferase
MSHKALETAPPPLATTANLALGILRACRPRQWVKNVLVIAAPGAAGVLTSSTAIRDTAIAFIAFCLAASGTYLLNDARDVEEDQLHPRKRFRPIAAGIVPVPLAVVLGLLLVAAAIALSFLTDTWLPVVVAGYVAMTTSYSMWFKHVPVVDLVVVASGFVLRALAGAAAVDVPVSSWFFIVASLGSLFMVAGKRESELRNLAAIGTRSTLEVYSHSYLSYVRAMSSGAVIVAYCLWALEAEGTTRVLFSLSIVPFAMGILRYALLVDAGSGESPEELVLHDRSLQVFGALLALLIGLGIYAT